MATNFNKQVSQRKQVKSITEKVEELQGAFMAIQDFVPSINEAFSRSDRQLGELALIVEAVVELFGPATVDAKIKEVADRKALAGLEQAQANLKAGLERGDLVVVDKVGEKSLVVGREIDSNGVVSFPGRAQLVFSQIKPDFSAKLLGQQVGFVMETSNGKFEVQEIYDIVDRAPSNDPTTPTTAGNAVDTLPTDPTAGA